jgi:hypothetical protein
MPLYYYNNIQFLNSEVCFVFALKGKGIQILYTSIIELTVISS